LGELLWHILHVLKGNGLHYAISVNVRRFSTPTSKWKHALSST